jgi:hypothetical protein
VDVISLETYGTLRLSLKACSGAVLPDWSAVLSSCFVAPLLAMTETERLAASIGA